MTPEERIKQLEVELLEAQQIVHRTLDRNTEAMNKFEGLVGENLRMMKSLTYIKKVIGDERFSEEDRFGMALSTSYNSALRTLSTIPHTTQLSRERDIACGTCPACDLKDALAARDRVYAKGKKS